MASSLRPWGSRFESERASPVHVSAWRSQPFSVLGCWISCFSKARPGQHHNFAQGLSFLVTQRSKCHVFHVVFSAKTVFSRWGWASWSSCFSILIFLFFSWYFQELRFHLVYFMSFIQFPTCPSCHGLLSRGNASLLTPLPHLHNTQLDTT